MPPVFGAADAAGLVEAAADTLTAGAGADVAGFAEAGAAAEDAGAGAELTAAAPPQAARRTALAEEAMMPRNARRVVMGGIVCQAASGRTSARAR